MDNDEVALRIKKLIMGMPEGSAMLVLVQVPGESSLVIHNMGSDEAASAVMTASAAAILYDTEDLQVS